MQCNNMDTEGWSQESREMQHWPTLCLIKDPLGSHKCFEQFDAVLIETYDQPGPMVRAQLFSLGANLLMCQASVQALLYAHVLMKALIYIFFSPGLSMSLPGTKRQPFLTSDSSMASICTDSATLLSHPAWVLFQPGEGNHDMLS